MLFSQDQLWIMGIVGDLFHSAQVELANVIAVVIDVVQMGRLELGLFHFGPPSDLRPVVRLNPLHHVFHVLFVQPHRLVSLVNRKEAIVALD